MPIRATVSITCDGVGCREGQDCDGFKTISEATAWARAEGWTVGKRVLCPKHQTPEAMQAIRDEEAEIAKISHRMDQAERYRLD